MTVDLAALLLADGPHGICTVCGRKSWDELTWDTLCLMTQPDGTACRGRIGRPDTAQAKDDGRQRAARGAKALYEETNNAMPASYFTPWDQLQPHQQEIYFEQARAVLLAADRTDR